MYIIIVGGGKVGYYLTKSLLEEGREVLVVEKDRRKCLAIEEELGGTTLQGDGCEVMTMSEAGMSRADVVIAVTGDDEDNLVVCQMAKRKFHVPRTIARLNNPKNGAIFHKLGIDVTISSTDLILTQIKGQIPARSLVNLLTLHQMGVNFVEIKLGPDSPAIGRPIRELGIPDDCIIPLVMRGEKAIIPYGDTVLAAGDDLIAVTSARSENTLREIMYGSKVSGLNEHRDVV